MLRHSELEVVADRKPGVDMYVLIGQVFARSIPLSESWDVVLRRWWSGASWLALLLVPKNCGGRAAPSFVGVSSSAPRPVVGGLLLSR